MTPNIVSAPTNKKGPVPAYKVRVFSDDDVFERDITFFDEKTGTIQKKKTTFNGGFLVMFPRGHSLFYHNREALINAGFGSIARKIDLKGEAELIDENDRSIGDDEDAD
jgi:hypothetical protein